MKKARRIITLGLIFCMMLSATAFGHSGRTDAYGGHKDNKNASGLGSYHYHHGYGPHLHPDGVCPYDNPAPAKSVSRTSTTNISAYINDAFIPSMNYKDNTYVVAEDLSGYGYDVVWDGTARSLTITRNAEKKTEAVASSNSNQTYVVEDTDIKAYLYDATTKTTKTLTSYNIGGRTIIRFNELGETTWNGTSRTTKLSA